MHLTVHLINIMRLNIKNAQPENPFTYTSQNIYCWKVTSGPLERTVNIQYIYSHYFSGLNADLNIREPETRFQKWGFYMDLLIIKT